MQKHFQAAVGNNRKHLPTEGDVVILWIATQNKHKLDELKLIANARKADVQFFSSSDLPTFFAPPENGKTYVENARIKARSVRAMKPTEWVLGEDSGLEILANNGYPGIHSARYAGPKASEIENRTKLLKMFDMRRLTDRRAKFVCTILALSPDGSEFIFTGELPGVITPKPRGTMGFGYDSVFQPDGEELTLAELGPGYKVQHSHRTRAFQAFLDQVIPPR